METSRPAPETDTNTETSPLPADGLNPRQRKFAPLPMRPQSLVSPLPAAFRAEGRPRPQIRPFIPNSLFSKPFLFLSQVRHPKSFSKYMAFVVICPFPRLTAP